MPENRKDRPAPHPSQANVPRPPSREEIEAISRAQQYITDDWTGEGGRPSPGGERR